MCCSFWSGPAVRHYRRNWRGWPMSLWCRQWAMRALIVGSVVKAGQIEEHDLSSTRARIR